MSKYSPFQWLLFSTGLVKSWAERVQLLQPQTQGQLTITKVTRRSSAWVCGEGKHKRALLLVPFPGSCVHSPVCLETFPLVFPGFVCLLPVISPQSHTTETFCNYSFPFNNASSIFYQTEVLDVVNLPSIYILYPLEKTFHFFNYNSLCQFLGMVGYLCLKYCFLGSWVKK